MSRLDNSSVDPKKSASIASENVPTSYINEGIKSIGSDEEEAHSRYFMKLIANRVIRRKLTKKVRTSLKIVLGKAAK